MVETLLALWLVLGSATHGEYLRWGDPRVAVVESYPVPPGKIWIVRAGGIFTDNSLPTDYMMEIIHPAASENDACCWRVPVARSPSNVAGTPVLALTRELILFPGEKLGARTTNLGNARIGLTFVYLEVTLPQ